MKRNIFSLYILTLLLVLLSLMVWEFWLESMIQPGMVNGFVPESVAEKWEYIKTVFIFCAIAFLFPAALALRIEKKRRATHKSLEELHRTTKDPFNEKIVEFTSIRTGLHGKDMEHALSGSTDHTIKISLQTLIDSIQDSIMIIDNNYRVRMLNRTARDNYFNGSEPSGPFLCHRLNSREDMPCSGTEQECPFVSVRESGKAHTVLHYHLDKHGHKILFEIQASPILSDDGDVIGIVELGRNVSSRIAREKKQREIEINLLNIQREQSIANLAGGLAHEFNNILTSILGNAELLSVRLDETNENIKQTEAIIAGSEYLGHLTKQLLAFAKEGKELNRTIDINEQIRDTLRLVYTDEFILNEVEMDLTSEVRPILGDPAQISQLIMNLVVNGFEALQTTEGKLIIRTANLTIDEKWECKLENFHPPGDYVLFSVTNTGSTISEEIIDKIFEPFFSTKLDNRGLGLAAAKGIVQNHNGCISVECESNQTTFQVLLPKEISDNELVDVVKSDPDGFAGLKVLVIDDEPQVLSIITSLLDHHDCNVLTSDNGKEALDIIERHHNDLDLVILDVQMPDMTGDKVYSQLKEIKPGLKVLITSGHAEYIALKNIILAPTDKFIKKPFRMSELILSIKSILVRD